LNIRELLAVLFPSRLPVYRTFEIRVKEAGSGLKTVFTTFDSAIIKKGFKYQYLETKGGKEFFENTGSLIFSQEHKFNWEEYTHPTNKKSWFLKMKI